MGRRSIKKEPVTENDSYLLPSEYDSLKNFISKFKVDMMQQIVSSIEFAMANKYHVIEVFQFKDSPFVITLNKNEFEPNLKHIHSYLKSKEVFGLCSAIEKLLKQLQKENNETKNEN